MLRIWWTLTHIIRRHIIRWWLVAWQFLGHFVCFTCTSLFDHISLCVHITETWMEAVGSEARAGKMRPIESCTIDEENEKWKKQKHNWIGIWKEWTYKWRRFRGNAINIMRRYIYANNQCIATIHTFTVSGLVKGVVILCVIVVIGLVTRCILIGLATRCVVDDT